MIKLKDLIRIIPNPKAFNLCIMDEDDNYNKHPREMTLHRCVTSDFKSFWFRDYEDRDYTPERILELLDYEVLCVNNYLYTGLLSNGDKWGIDMSTGETYPEDNNEYDKLSHDFFIYIDKPLQKKKGKVKEEKQTDLFEGVEDEDLN